MLKLFFWIVGTVVLAAVLFNLLHNVLGIHPNTAQKQLQQGMACLVLGFMATTFLIGKAGDALESAGGMFGGTYRPGKDYDPQSMEPQYLIAMPGRPWYGVWQNTDDDSLYLFEKNWAQMLTDRPYFNVTELSGGGQQISYYRSNVPATEDTPFQMIYAKDGLTLQVLTESGDTLYELKRPERAKGKALPEKFWGYWITDTQQIFVSGSDLLRIDAFIFDDLYDGVKQIKSDEYEWYRVKRNGERYYLRLIEQDEAPEGVPALFVTTELNGSFGNIYYRLDADTLQAIQAELSAQNAA